MQKDNEIKYKKGDKQKIAYDYIKNAIIKNVYKPQMQIVEKNLSEELGGLSRTPIRDAIKKLQFEGLIETRPGQGTVVAGVSVKDVLEITEIRRSLEPLSVELFVERADPNYLRQLEDVLKKQKESYENGDYFSAVECDNKFHLILASGSMNTRLASITEQLLNASARCSFLTRFDEERVHHSVEQHEKIIKALEDGDAQKAIKMLTDHLDDWRNYLAEQQINNYFMFNV